MGAQLVPIAADAPFFEVTVNLDGTDYLLFFRYNQRRKVYTLDVSLSDRTSLAIGIALVCNFGLLRRFADERLPPGDLFAVALGSEDYPPGVGELGEGRRVELYYLPGADIKDGYKGSLG